MRLTKKISENDYLMICEIDALDGIPNVKEQAKKLGQLEDIEEELGIDLTKLLSAKKVYYMGWDRNCDGFEIKETYKLFINLTDRTIEYYGDEYSEFTFDLELKNYGKNDIYGGWALTKEELL